MKPILVALSCAVLGASTSFASTTAPPAVPSVDVVTELKAINLRADRAVVKYYEEGKELRAEVPDAKWFERLASLLGSASYRSQGQCFCIYYPQIQFFEKNVSLGQISLGGSETLQVYSTRLGGDFEIQADVGRQIFLLTMEKRGLVPPSRPKLPPFEPPKINIRP